MALKIVVSKDPATLADRGGSAFIGRSGVYPVKIDFVSLEQSDKGAVHFNLNVDYQGNKQTIYGNTLFNTDQSVNKIGMELFNRLLNIAGLDDGYEITTETETHKVGKDQKAQEFQVVPELTGLEIQVQVKEVFSRYNGDIKRSLEIYNFFDADGATAMELVAYATDKTIKKGTQLAKILEKDGTTEPLYRENKGTKEPAPTPEEVAAWKEAQRSGSSTPAPATKVAAGNLFAKKNK